MRNHSFQNPTGFCSLVIVAGTVLASLASTAPAGTIRHDRDDADYRALAAQPQFASVGRVVGLASFILIAPDWALTAAHVVDLNLDGVADPTASNRTYTVGGQSRQGDQFIVPVGINGNRGWNGNINNGFDIALVHLTQPITSVAPASLYTSFQELGKTITSVGFGATGTGKTGAYLASGTKRAGTNVVDRFARGPNGELGFANGASALAWDFDEPSPGTSPNQSGSGDPLDMEYLIAGGDSGGGSFIFENGAWYLAGVHSGTYPSYNYPLATDNDSTYGDEALITRVAAYQDFIFNSIPDLAVAVPEPANLAVLALAGLIAMRRRRGA
ncbi:MAG: trypsin-like serine protease [Planctomycetota bacterium]|nr:trypsin-like serine protease [Planctomycetota bacterium]